MTEEQDRDRGNDPPRDVSDQNREEQSAPHPPAAGHAAQDSESTDPPRSDRAPEYGQGVPGGAGESSQATGHPDNAG